MADQPDPVEAQMQSAAARLKEAYEEMPPDIQQVVRDSLKQVMNDPRTHEGLAVAVNAVKRAVVVGPFVAIAEIDNPEFRMIVANTFTEMCAKIKKQ